MPPRKQRITLPKRSPDSLTRVFPTVQSTLPESSNGKGRKGNSRLYNHALFFFEGFAEAGVVVDLEEYDSRPRKMAMTANPKNG